MATDQSDSVPPVGTIAQSIKVDLPPEFTPGVSVASHFDEVYQAARGESSRVPWAQCGPDPCLLHWLNAEARVLVRPGCRAVVVGCGLGDDVVELAGRGYDVQGFDISPTAVQWAARRHPDHAERFFVADLLAPPGRLLKRFDLVVEVRTIQSLAPAHRPAVAKALAGLVCNRGVLITIACGRPAEEPLSDHVGQPWPLTAAELVDLFSPHGMAPIHGPCGIEETVVDGVGGGPPHRRLCGAFMRM